MVKSSVLAPWYRPLAHFKVTAESEAGVDFVLIQPLLFYYVNHVVLMLTSIFKHNFHEKGKEVCIKTGQTQPHVQSKARILSPKCKMVYSSVTSDLLLLKESDDVRKGYSNPLTLFQTKICDFPDPKFRPEQKFEALPLATTATTLCQMLPITQNSLD